MANESVPHSCAPTDDEAEFLELLRQLKAAGKLPEFLATFRMRLAGRTS
jgi:hypothetical protein